MRGPGRRQILLIGKRMRPVLWRVLVLFLMIAVQSGFCQTRVLHFPPDRSLGTLVDLDKPLGDPTRYAPHWWMRSMSMMGETIAEARGEIAVPADRRVGLVVKPQSPEDNLAPLSRLNPADIELLGFDDHSPKPGDKSLPSLCALGGLKTLILDGTAITNEGLARLKGLKSLEKLSVLQQDLNSTGIANIGELKSLKGLRLFTATTVTVEDLSHLSGLASLQEMFLDTGRLEGQGLSQLSRMPALEYLHLGMYECRGEGFEYLPQIPALRRLSFYDLRGEGVAALPAMPELRELGIQYKGDAFTPEQMASLGRLTGLEHLRLTARYTDEGIAHLKSLKRLKTIELHAGWQDPDYITDAALSHLKELKDLESVVAFTGKFTDEGLRYLSELPRLKIVKIPNSDFTNAGLEYLGRIKGLEELEIRGFGMTDEGLKHLEGLTSLKSLTFEFRTKITEAGLTRLRERLPNLKRIEAGKYKRKAEQR